MVSAFVLTKYTLGRADYSAGCVSQPVQAHVLVVVQRGLNGVQLAFWCSRARSYPLYCLRHPLISREKGSTSVVTTFGNANYPPLQLNLPRLQRRL